MELGSHIRLYSTFCVTLDISSSLSELLTPLIISSTSSIAEGPTKRESKGTSMVNRLFFSMFSSMFFLFDLDHKDVSVRIEIYSQNAVLQSSLLKNTKIEKMGIEGLFGYDRLLYFAHNYVDEYS